MTLICLLDIEITYNLLDASYGVLRLTSTVDVG